MVIMRVLISVCAVYMLCAFGCGCGPGRSKSNPVTQRDLVGTYHVKWEPYRGRNLGGETLILKSDGTFSQAFTSAGGGVFKNVGTWNLERGPSGPVLRLSDVKRYVSKSYDAIIPHPKPEGQWLSVYKRANRIYLVIDEDNGLYYTSKP